MTCCVGIAVEEGLVVCSDSRTHAGSGQVSTYSKMHRFGVKGRCQLVILSAGNLASTQAMLARVKEETRAGGLRGGGADQRGRHPAIASPMKASLAATAAESTNG